MHMLCCRAVFAEYCAAVTYIRRLATSSKKGNRMELTIVKPPGAGGARGENGALGGSGGGGGADDAALDKLRERLEGAGIPKESFETIEKDLTRLSRLPKSSAEYDLVRSYLGKGWLCCVVLCCVLIGRASQSFAPICRGASRATTALV